MSCAAGPPDECPARFDRLAVSRLAAGESTVSWQAGPGYRGPGLATLEVSGDGPSGPFAAAVAGAAASPSPVLVDPTPPPAPDRVWYRVRLSDSGPGVKVSAAGALRRGDRLAAVSRARARIQTLLDRDADLSPFARPGG